jgi:2-isopropylmalate synthase
MTIKLYDTTLRDGSQQEGVSFSLSDKLKICQELIDFEIDFIEGGFPGSNPKDAEFFQAALKLNWHNSKLVAFAATRHKGRSAKGDPSLIGALESGAQYVTVFGKTSALHAERILGVSKAENLEIISSSVEFLTSSGVKVLFDAEHSFDGFLEDEDYHLACLRAAAEAGAFNISLCDTNGGALPWQVAKQVQRVKKELPKINLGIHTHNDSGFADASSLIAVKEGAELIQGTINGYGEGTGNANLCVIMPNLKLKLQKDFQAAKNLAQTTLLSKTISEIANQNPPRRAPFVGTSAFTHKAGIHVAAISKLPASYEHIRPEQVGNLRRITVSELSGKTNIVLLAKELGIELDSQPDLVRQILSKVKELEAAGMAFEGADASLALLIKRMLPDYQPPFALVDFLIINRLSRQQIEAEVQVKIATEINTAIGYGNGPVNAVDNALKKALNPHFDQLKKIKLTDYKVRIIDPERTTAAKTRVHIEFFAGSKTWTCVGCEENITKASVQALIDGLEYGLLGC